MVSERIQRRIERLLDQIELEADKQDWPRVIELAKEVLGFAQDNDDANAFLRVAEERLSVTPSSTERLGEVETTATELSIPSASAPEAERRQLTVMFCDLQGSTALSQQLDPEVLRDVIRGYQEVCAGAVGRFEGHIAKYLGDGLLVYFGYPRAHEDDPQRAVRAGLAILQDMNPLNARLKSEKDLELVVRIGIHTGLVVAGEMGGGDTLEELAIVGETPNIAARIEGAALPNSVVVSDITANLIQGFFRYETLGPHELKGIAEPVELFQVLEESGAQTRFEVAAEAELTPLVGRDQEVGLLLDRWEQAEEGLGQVVLLSGEAGIGKSRLLEALSERLIDETHIKWQFQCSAYHQNSALHPIIELLDRWLGFLREDSSEEKLDKLESALAAKRVDLSYGVPLLASLFSLPLDGRYPPVQTSPEGQKELIREILVRLLMEADDRQPVLLVFEDLQWADPTTLELVSLLVDQAPTAQVLAMFTFRPEFTPPWGSRAYLSQITLNRLPRRLANDMLAVLTGGKEFPEEIVTQIATKSDGVPLFVEELTRMVIESGLIIEEEGRYVLSGPLPELAIPSTLQDSLTARLDRLSSVRESAQLAAILGREFSHNLIRAVSPLDDATLVQHLEQLVTGEFLYQRGVPPDAEYTFKHALIQDAAYNSLLISRRQQYHQLAAQALGEHFANVVDAQPELLAHHYFEAGLTDEAVSYWLKAGERSLAQYAWEEALAHFQRALSVKDVDLISSEPATDSDTADLLFGLGRAQSATLGRQELHLAVGSMYRAFEFYAQTNDVASALAVAEYPIQALPGHRGGGELVRRALRFIPSDSPEAGRLWARYGLIAGMEEGDYQAAEEAFGNALTIAQRTGDIALEMRILGYFSRVDYWYEHWQGTIEKGLRVIEMAEQVEDQLSVVAARFWVGVVYLHSGQSEGTRLQAQAALLIAESLRDRYLLATTLWLNEMLSLYQGDWQAGKEFNERGLLASPSDSRLVGTRMLLEYQTGNEIDGHRFLAQIVERIKATTPGPSFDYSSAALHIPMVALITGREDQVDLAVEAAESVLSAPTASPTILTFARQGLALVAVIRKDKDSAREHYDALRSSAGTIHFISSDRVLGLLAVVTGDFDKSATHFEDAIAFTRKGGYRPETAWSCINYADILLERGAEGDRTKAVLLLDESLAISTELGMPPLMERVQARLERVLSA